MSKVHGKRTVITIDGDNISQYCNTSDFTRTTDSHDTTTYGANGHTYNGGLTDGTFTLGGFYDNTASTGPRAVLEPLVGGENPIEIIRQPDGAGSGKAQDTFDALLTSYVETSPVADMVTWSADFQISGDVDSTAQAA